MTTAYLGGALAIEIAEGQVPIGGVLLVLVWLGTYLEDKTIFGITSK